jgi:hypothetical protein
LKIEIRLPLAPGEPGAAAEAEVKSELEPAADGRSHADPVGTSASRSK